MTKFLIAALLALPISLFAQRTAFPPPPAPIAQDPPMFYVPFNDRGKWGYSDTLGNIVIKPAFDQASLFSKKANVEGVVISAEVMRKGKKDRIDAMGKSLLPKKTELKLFKQFRRSNTGLQILCLVANKKGHWAVVQVGKEAKPDFNYSPIPGVDPTYGSAPIFLRNRETKLIEQYDIASHKFRPSDYSQAMKMYPAGKSSYARLYAVTSTGDTLMFDGRNFRPAVFKPGVDYIMFAPDDKVKSSDSGLDGPEFEYMEIEEEEFYLSLADKAKLSTQFKVDAILDNAGFSRYLSGKYGISKLYVAQRGSLFGVIDQDGKELLPFTYDRITLEDDGTQAAIYLNGKVGRKLFFTIYPAIEPIYDSLYEYHSYRVNRRWSFVVYLGQVNGEAVLVGENGTKYYRLKR